MTSAGRHEEQRQRTRRRIQDTAVDLFREHGYEAVSIQRIATEAGVSLPTFYKYFPSKEHLIVLAPTEETVRFLLSLTSSDLPPGARVRDSIVPFLRAVPPDQREGMLVRWRLVASTPTLRDRVAEFERMTARMVFAALAETEPPQRTSPASEVAVAASLAAYTQVLLIWAESDGQLDLDKIAEDVLSELREL